MRRNGIRGLLLVVWVVAFLDQAFCGVVLAALKGGCARVDITPPLGIPLIGSYGKPSDSIRDELYAKAMVLGDGAETIVIVSADLLYAPLEDITNPVRAAIQERTGISAQNIMVCATHTHSGPEVFTRTKVPREGRLPASQIDQSYLRVLIGKLADSAVIAWQNMQDVRVAMATGALPEVLYNRRPVMGDGQVKTLFSVPAEVAATRKVERSDDGSVRAVFTFAPEEPRREFGPIDPSVCVIRVEKADGGLVGSLVNFGCHPVCIYPTMPTVVSADYPAFAARVVERATGGINLFALGLAGNTVPLRRGAAPCERMGTALGAEALKTLQLMTTTDEATLQARTRKIVLPLKGSLASGDRTTDVMQDMITSEIQVMRLGSFYVLGLPGEVLVEVGLEIRSRANVENLLFVTLANDAIGYVCHRQAHEQGGYEPTSGTDLAPGAGEIMVEQALALLHEIAP